MSSLTDSRPLAGRVPFRAVAYFLVAVSLAGALLVFAGHLMTWAAASTSSQAGSLFLTQETSGMLTVDSSGDTGDALPGDGQCDDGSGACTLRAAIEEANALAGREAIVFAIPGEGPHLIQPASPLPALTEPVVLDATSAAGYAGVPVVVLDGSRAGRGASGLTLAGGDSVVRGLSIQHFDYSAIHITGDGHNRIEANFLGVGPLGTAEAGNEIGVLVDGSADNAIGGTGERQGNVIAGNEVGVYLYGQGARGNVVLGNTIGADATDASSSGNRYGVRITNAAGNLIGGTEPGARNTIAGNETGVYIAGRGASGNKVQGNLLGLDATGRTALPNGQGIYVNGAPGNLLGGIEAGASNVIVARDTGVTVRGGGATGNQVQGNKIGLDSVGTVISERADTGVYIVNAGNNVVGGTDSGAGNRIASQVFGVYVRGLQAASNQVTGNTVDVADEVLESAGASSGGVHFATAGHTLASDVEPDAAITAPSDAHRQASTVDAAAQFGPRFSLAPLSTALPPLQSGTTFTVTATGDSGDANPGDGICDDGAGDCTLRAAIQEANALSGMDTIAFDIPGTGPHTIQPQSLLTVITDPLIIDGTTEPDFAGSPVVELDGTYAGAASEGVTIEASGSVIRGLAVNRFDDAGIDIDGTAAGVIIEGNVIGTDIGGSIAQGNLGVGVNADDGHGHTIGGTTTAARNLISGNGSHGIDMTSGVTNTYVLGNYIGTDASGAVALGNGGAGVFIGKGGGNGGDNVIGSASAGNLISGNDAVGVRLGSDRNTVAGNLIGTTADGSAALGNGHTGISVRGSSRNVIGGTTAGSRNVISANGSSGILIRDSSAISNTVQGNFIGTDASGTIVLGNDGSGIRLGGAGNTVGGLTTGARNVIAGNGAHGIWVRSNGHFIHGNYIGTDVTGTEAIANSRFGVFVHKADGNTIGGSDPGAGNVMSGSKAGINIAGGSSNIVQGNLVGIAVDGITALGNSDMGIRIGAVDNITPTNNVIGGTKAGEGNIVAYNGDEGLEVKAGTGHILRGNAIFANGNRGIDLSSDGVTANDAGDADTGPNNLQNYPVLSAASSNPNATTITGTLNSTSNTQFTLDFYASDSCDSSGYGEGERYLGTDTVTTDGSGDASFTSIVAESTGSVAQVTATATDPNGNTSEFSACVQATYDAQASLQANFSASPTSGTAPLQVAFTDTSTPSGAADVWSWDFGDGGTSTVQHPVYTYTVAGAYTVTLTITDTDTSETDTLVRSSYITVEPPVTADFTASPTSGVAPLEVTFTDASTPAGAADGWSWDFGDGGSSTAQHPVYTYTVPGTYTVTLTVTDTETSQTDTLVQANYIVVNEPATVDADFTATPTSGTAPLEVAFTDASTPAGAADAWFWDFGDGNSSADQNPAHTYTAVGVFTVTLTVTDTGTSQSDTLVRSNYITVTATTFTETWQTMTTTTAPPVDGEYAMAYDGGRDVVVLYGGNGSGWPYENGTWEFDGSDWTQVATTNQPGAVYGMALAYDAGRGVMVLFGGSDSADGELAETWEYDGTDWTQAAPTASPPARTGASMAYEGSNVYLFGGNDDATTYGDLWQYDGTTWNQVSTGTAPPARTLAALAYHAGEGRLYLFGGRDGNGDALADLWAFDPVAGSWSEIVASGPQARYAHSLAYDASSASLVLSGGAASAGDTVRADTWHYQVGSGWSEGTGSGGTPATAYHGAVYDETNQHVILFQDGTTWTYR